MLFNKLIQMHKQNIAMDPLSLPSSNDILA